MSIIVHPEKQSQFDQEYRASSDNQHVAIYEMEEVKSESLDDEPREEDVDENLQKLEQMIKEEPGQNIVDVPSDFKFEEKDNE